MADWEQKLKTYFENNADYKQSDAFVESLKSLEAEQTVLPKRRERRYYLLPIAALLVIGVTVGVGWRYLRPTLPTHTPVPQPMISQKEPDPVLPDESTITPKVDPQAETDIMQPQNSEESRKPSQRTTKPEHSTPVSPDDPTPDDPLPDDPPIVEPPVDDPPPDDPPPVDPPMDDPPDDPPPDDPPDDDPPDIDPEDIPAPQISASYQKEGSIELVTLTNQSTGENITIDVTGCAGSPIALPAGQIPADFDIYATVYCGVIDAFGVTIYYDLYRYSNGFANVITQIVN